MKKLALALALVGFAAVASAQTSVYGVVDMGVQRDFSNNRTSLDSSLQSESRIGFRRREDLGNGTSAIFGLETGFNADTGTNTDRVSLFSREAFVGLQGSFGTVKLGRQSTPIYNALYALDPFQTGLAGNASNLMNDGGRFANNSVSYSSSFGSVTGQFMYGMGREVPGNYVEGRTVGSSISIPLGPVNAIAAYHAVNANGSRSSTTLLGATVDVGTGFKLHTAFADNAGGKMVSDSRDYMLGVSANVTSTDTVLGSVVHKDVLSHGGGDATQYAVGLTHDLSQRTNLYTSYGYTRYDLLPSDNVVNVGIRHRF